MFQLSDFRLGKVERLELQTIDVACDVDIGVFGFRILHIFTTVLLFPLKRDHFQKLLVLKIGSHCFVSHFPYEIVGNVDFRKNLIRDHLIGCFWSLVLWKIFYQLAMRFDGFHTNLDSWFLFGSFTFGGWIFRFLQRVNFLVWIRLGCGISYFLDDSFGKDNDPLQITISWLKTCLRLLFWRLFQRRLFS